MIDYKLFRETALLGCLPTRIKKRPLVSDQIGKIRGALTS
jgi:hypothetical protein